MMGVPRNREHEAPNRREFQCPRFTERAHTVVAVASGSAAVTILDTGGSSAGVGRTVLHWRGRPTRHGCHRCDGGDAVALRRCPGRALQAMGDSEGRRLPAASIADIATPSTASNTLRMMSASRPRCRSPGSSLSSRPARRGAEGRPPPAVSAAPQSEWR